MSQLELQFPSNPYPSRPRVKRLQKGGAYRDENQHIYFENDVVSLREAVIADVVGEARSVVLPIGAKGVVVLVHEGPSGPVAYEVEFYVQEQDCYALATILSGKV